MPSGAEDSLQELRRQGGPQSPPAAKAKPNRRRLFAFDFGYPHRFEETSMLLNDTAANFGKTLRAGAGSLR
jgi:hypothetical protein